MVEPHIENEVYPEDIDLKLYKEEKRCYWGVVILEQQDDKGKKDKFDNRPEFLKDTHLFEKVLFIIVDPEKMTA